MSVKKNVMLWVTVFALALPLMLAGEAGAVYFEDGAKKTQVTPTAVYDNPNDGMCVVGIAANGDMLVDTSIKNSRDCVAYTENLTDLTTQAACAPTTGGVGTDGWRHSWTMSTSFCRSSSNGAVGIARTDMDNSTPMCVAKGGTVGFTGYAPGGACIAYGWLYRGIPNVSGVQTVQDLVGTVPTVVPFNNAKFLITKGVTIAEGANPQTTGLGFCYASMNFTADASYTATTCPTVVNFPTTPASINNWSWATTAPIGCRNSLGVNGALVGAIAATGNVAGNVKAIGDVVDLTTFTTQGACIANGYSWENWTPTTGLVQVGTSGHYYAGMDFTAGAKFTTRQCLRCHSDQSRSTIGRNKPGFVKTGHKTAGDSDNATWAAIGTDWGLKGVQCSMCHAGANPTTTDKIQITAAGAARSTGTHDNNAFGAQVTQVCYHCHSDATKGVSVNTTPATLIPIANNAQGLAPIANQFLNSPHAKYSGNNGGAALQNKANYTSTFVGMICRTANSVGGGSIYDSYWDGSAPQLLKALDSNVNTLCTTSATTAGSGGIGGYMVKEGSVATDAQGNCSTCHDVHWSLEDATPRAFNSSKVYTPEPIRRECETCHVTPGTKANSASSAPQVSATINHPTTGGTPFDTNMFKNACEVCHMPKATSGGSAAHLWRINTSASYTTMGASAVNLDGNNLAWIDVDLACGQCHGGSAGSLGTKNGAMYKNKVQLAAQATWMHAGTSGTCSAATVGSTITAVGNVVTLTDTSTNAKNVTINWGDGNSEIVAQGSATAHTYSSRVATYTIKQIANANGDCVSASKIVKQLVAPVKTTVTVTVTGNAAAKLALKKQNPSSGKVSTVAVLTGSGTFSVADGTYFVTCKGGSFGPFIVPTTTAVAVTCN